MGGLRDYQQWHQQYDDPESEISWRLRTVQDQIRAALDATAGAYRILSLCAGDGRDVIGVLSERDDADRFRATLVELHPDIAEQARERASRAGLPQVEVRTADAGAVDYYADVVPVQLLLLVGIFGNISDEDIGTTIAAAPQLCAPGATVLWSRGRSGVDLNDQVRAWFVEAGFTEVVYVPHRSPTGPAMGAMRYPGAPGRLVAGQQLFTFIR